MTLQKSNDKAIIARLKKGDSDAFTQVYKAYYEKLCRYVYSLSSDEKIAEDIAQEQLMQLWVKRDSLNILSLNAYLYRSAFNKYINIYKQEQRKNSLINELRVDSLIEVENSSEQLKEKRLSILRKIIDDLPEKRREIFILSKINNYKYKEIAEMKNISERTVESQIRKALITIRLEVSKINSPLDDY